MGLISRVSSRTYREEPKTMVNFTRFMLAQAFKRNPPKKVKFSVLNNAGVILLNRPEKHNAFDESMIDDIHKKLEQWTDPNSRIKLIIQKGAGDKAFCVGGDVTGMVHKAADGNPEYAKRIKYKAYRLNYAIHNYPIPFVSIIDGYTMGSGVGVSTSSRYRVATE